MANPMSRYQQMNRYMTWALIADGALFFLYLIVAACAVIWLKVICAILIFLISGGCLGLLYLTKELKRKRSQWMSVAAISCIVCLLFSLILNFP